MAARLFLVLLGLAGSALGQQAAWNAYVGGCSRTCAVENCGSPRIRYGKFCGIAHTGCPGQAPCDWLDACCKQHDQCVSSIRVIWSNACHDELAACMAEVEASGEPGFSSECPLDMVLPVLKARRYNNFNLEGIVRATALGRALLGPRAGAPGPDTEPGPMAQAAEQRLAASPRLEALQP